MIRYQLNCAEGHTFEAWFSSSKGYDAQVRRKQVTCPVCGTDEVKKAIMSPRVARSRSRKQQPVAEEAPVAPTKPASPEIKPAAAEKPKDDCNPPYYFEGSKKVFKPNCL